MSKPADKVLLNARIDAQLHTALKIRAAEDRRTMTQILEEALHAYLAKPKKGP